MKNKFLGKFILSGAALAACATTLVTSTFAWYTSNTEVTTGSSTVATSTNVDTSSIYIANALTYTGKLVNTLSDYRSFAVPTLMPTVAVGEKQAPATHTLEPVYFNTSDKTFKKKKGQTPVEGYTLTDDSDVVPGKEYYTKESDVYTKVASPVKSSIGTYYEKNADTVEYSTECANDVIELTYRFRTAVAGDTKTVYFSKFDINSTGYANAGQVALVGANSTGITNVGKEYKADILKALKMNVTTIALDSTGNYTYTYSAANMGIDDSAKENYFNAHKGSLYEKGTDETYTLTGDNSYTSGTTYYERSASPTENPTVYGLSNFVKNDTNPDLNISTANAIGYYNAVLGTNLAIPEENYEVGTELAATTGGAEALALFTIPTSGYIEVRFSFYLDGWDTYCYDTMLKQSFTVDMSFTNESTKGVVKQA